MDTESLSLQMGTGMKETFMKVILTGRELINGSMGGNTLENTKKIKWKGRESLHGPKEDAMKEIILTTKSRATECLLGLMGSVMKACESMESSTEKEL